MRQIILDNLNNNLTIEEAFAASNLSEKNFLVCLRSILNYGLNENRKKEVINILKKEISSYLIECSDTYRFIGISDTHF